MENNYTPAFKEKAIDEMIKRSSFTNLADYIKSTGKSEFITKRNKFYNTYAAELIKQNKELGISITNDEVERALKRVIEEIKTNPKYNRKDLIKKAGFHSSYFSIATKLGYFENKGNRLNPHRIVKCEDTQNMIKEIRKYLRENQSKKGLK